MFVWLRVRVLVRSCENLLVCYSCVRVFVGYFLVCSCVVCSCVVCSCVGALMCLCVIVVFMCQCVSVFVCSWVSF